jgi:hypothetical protein
MQIYCKAQKATDRVCGVLLEINWVDIFLKPSLLNLAIIMIRTMNNLQGRSDIIKKPSRPSHFGKCENKMSVDGAYELGCPLLRFLCP